MMKYKNIIIILFPILIFISSCSSSTTTIPPNPEESDIYYVAKNGSDNNPGTADLPWSTIQHAADKLTAGDTVYIREGIYNEHVYTVQSGNAKNYIVFSAYPGETPIIEGTAVTESQNGIIIDKSYIKLIGLEISNWKQNAIWINNAGYIEISDCEIHNVFYGIGVVNGTHHFEFNRVVVHHFDLYGFDVSPSGGDDCYQGIFNDCIAYGGRDPAQNVDGFALGHGEQYDFTFNRCESYAVFDGFDISAHKTTLNRCSAHDCLNGGYKLWQDDVTLLNCLSYHNNISNVELDWDGEPGITILQNCTFVDAQVYNIWVENRADSLYMYNCILAGGDNIGLAFEQRDTSNYKGDYNLFHNDNVNRTIAVGYTDEFSLDKFADWKSYSNQDTHSLIAASVNNLFVNPVSFNLHSLESSPAVDQGTDINTPSEDYDGITRPQGKGYDIGAYEK